jgi:hypothetical protein
MASTPSKDLIFGAEEIAAELGVKVRRVYYWHRKKLLPITKVGRTLAASRSKLQRAIDKQLPPAD